MSSTPSLRSAGIALCGLFSLLVAANSLHADESIHSMWLKEINDPTILKSRIWTDVEWDQSKHGIGFGKVTLGSLWAGSISPDQDIAVRLKVPFAWRESGDVFGNNDHAGLGDIEVAVGTAVRLTNKWRVGGGLELHADSATDPSLGDQVWRAKPFLAVGYDLRDWLALGFIAEYNHSVSERAEIDGQRYLELFWPVTFVLPHLWSITAQYKGKIDFEAQQNWTQSAKLVVAKQFEKLPFNVAAAVEKELDGGNKQFQVNLITTWFF